MSAFMSKVSATQTRGAYGQVKRRWMHGSLKRQAIMMPAMSPLMTEGTIARWMKKEGEAFKEGDVLLQLELEFYTVDVEAHTPGILGKILVSGIGVLAGQHFDQITVGTLQMPDGTKNVPIEQIIALVALDASELALLQNENFVSVPKPPPFNLTPTPPSISANGANTPTAGTPVTSIPSAMASPRCHTTQFKLPLTSPRTPTMSPRTPSLFEMHTMGYGQRSAHVGGPRGLAPITPMSANESARMPPCPSPHVRVPPQVEVSTPLTPMTAKWPVSAGPGLLADDAERTQVDGAAIRRMIVSNLASKQSTKISEVDELF
ncbi:unnamed protein product [Cyclocybe aegerita]|uniref:Lipoyl-binding domain-containing protein n=1 Tax=Cyclocybe aegerita TaxID=1973307 RepID=A0A8S0XT57_CYCAE|nr:unnamed protein product [Cyclocybe aegerita]